MNKNLQNIPLNLDDPAVIEALKEADVSKKVSAPVENYDQKISESIKARQKAATFSMKLNQAQVDKLTREAASLDTDWKSYFQQQIEETILGKNIGSPTISSPSFGRAKVVGPSSWLKDNA